MSHEDRARPTRPGEELDGEALKRYLEETLGQPYPLQILQFPGGHSNLTYLLRWGPKELVLRRPPVGSKVKGAHDMGREFRILEKLGATYDKAPRVLSLCSDESVLGCEFYVMERVRGIILRKEFPAALPSSAGLCDALCCTFVQTLVDLHGIDTDAIGLGDLGHPDGYTQRQVEGWTKRYNNARTDHIPAMDELATWLAANVPPPQRTSLLHNDFKFDNLVLREDEPTKVVGILDWEMATRGDPLMDLGTALSYWVQSDDPAPLHSLRFGPTHAPGMWTRSELAMRYSVASGLSIDKVLFYFVFGLFKSAGVVQQIYYRYRKGLTRDERFAQFIHAVRLLSDQAVRALERGKV